MNTPNPLVPKGSIPSRGKSTVRIAFFTIAAIHVVFIGGLLMQGCKKPENKALVEETNNTPPPLMPYTNDLAATDTNLAAPTVPATASNAVAHPPEPTTAEPAPTGASREYVVAKGDSFSTIAKKMHVSVKAIEQANPGVISSKLKVNQKLQLPDSSSASPTASATSSSTTGPAESGDTTIYVVKAGDMLEKIARTHSTTSKAIMRMNNLKTTMIKPGQKLKLPASKAPSSGPVAGSSYVTPLPSGAAAK
ncbi:MAG: LysM peptidoglycan-binding domain-containing protein [Verrucomicrobiota bacterium]